jgi:hypothetical protein
VIALALASGEPVARFVRVRARLEWLCVLGTPVPRRLCARHVHRRRRLRV